MLLLILYETAGKKWLPNFFQNHPVNEGAIFLCVVVLFMLASMASNVVEHFNKVGTHDDIPRYRFGLCYAVVEELEKYLTSGMESRLIQAGQYLKAMLWYCRPVFSLNGGLSNARASRSIHRLTIDPLFWLRLRADSEEILDGVEQIESKILQGVRSGANVAAILASLREVAGYLYSIIPGRESVDGVPKDVLEDYGKRCLLKASAIIREIPVIEESRNPGFWQKLWPRIGGAVSYYSHPSAPARYLVGSHSTLAAMLLCFRVVGLIYPFKVDNTIIAVIVVTPFTVAAAALAFVGKTKGSV